jgi:dolichyl-phosphate beta-glucosyltransferase
MQKRVSIIVPAYNEERRIGRFLEELLEFAKAQLDNYEIIIVDDGSVDNTLNVVKNIVKKDRSVRIVSYKPNRGKGFAVKTGVFKSKGEFILFIDSDGSISPEQILKMLKELEKYDVVVGDRGHRESIIRQAKSRKIIGIIFNFYVSILFNSRVRDNLCGFKGFRRRVALELFKNLVDKKWLFDVELFYKIKKRGYSFLNIPIKWEHKTGSKISLFDPFKMLFQLIDLRIRLIDS